MSNFEWSPNGTQIAFLMKDSKTEEEEEQEKEKRDVIIVDENFKYNHIYVKQFSTEVDTNGADRITEGNFSVNSFNWSPDSRWIVFAHNLEPTFNSRSISGDISVVNLSDKSTTILVEWPGVDADPVFSPDGKWVAFASDGGKIERIGLADCFVVSSSHL